MEGDGEYDYDIYDEDMYADEDPYNVDEYNWDPYFTGEGSSGPIPKPRSRQQQRLDAARQQRRLDAAQGIINIHNDAYMGKEPCRTSALTGVAWVAELNVGHPKRMYQSFRMSKTNFFALCELLESRYGLEEGERISVQEQVAIFLWIVGQRANNRNAQERFQHSGETISRRFYNILHSLNAMAIEWIKPWPWPREEVHSKILRNSRYYPHFANCIEAIDGTHIKAHPEPEQLLRWIGRKGYPTQNIMAACDFDMCFTFALTGWEGSAHDTRIFNDCLRNPALNFPAPRGDEFYLVDAGYPNTRGFLAPYKGCIYHTPEWRNGAVPRNAYEKFNKIHSSLRCTIERTFGVWKARWPLVCDIPVGYTMDTQRNLVTKTMAIHNFIRRSNMPDIPFGFYDRRPNFLPSDAGVETTAPNGQHGHAFVGDDQDMETVRASIRDWIVANRIK